MINCHANATDSEFAIRVGCFLFWLTCCTIPRFDLRIGKIPPAVVCRGPGVESLEVHHLFLDSLVGREHD